ncbi:hypothetical protein ACRYCC_25165 [Actinomadura scrupuli]|uniref:hypothetical protein n=1 Tax=Actinomadura scrupuli TaxID=559629 RepID=UPI003D961455
MRSPIRHLVSLAAAAVLTASAAGAATSARADGGTPGGSPLPGYTIVNPPLAPAIVHGVASRVLQGVHHHAAYDIEVPPGWNGRLVLWAHGYAGQGKVLTVSPPPFGLRGLLLDQGYAWAASSYYDNGYDVRAGVVSTRELAVLFGSKVAPPRQRLIVGASMGGHVIGRSLEQYPGFYAGAMPMCGVLGADDLFDYLLDYHLVAQDLAGIRAYPAPPDYLTATVPRIQQALGLTGLTPTGPDTTNDLGKQFRAIVANRTGGTRPGFTPSFAVWKDYVFTLGAPATGTTLAEDPGRVATNLFTRYAPNSPVDVNATVQRVMPADPAARLSPRLSQVPLIQGAPRVPVLSLHGLGDLFVPFSMEQIYASRVARHHQSGLLVQRAIRTTQHCEFSPTEAATGWNDLVRWVGTGHRPAGDAVSDPSAVAGPDFGCRFSDAAAYAAEAGTRRLYSACPAG